jgi:hypothetical protein
LIYARGLANACIIDYQRTPRRFGCSQPAVYLDPHDPKRTSIWASLIRKRGWLAAARRNAKAIELDDKYAGPILISLFSISNINRPPLNWLDATTTGL